MAQIQTCDVGICNDVPGFLEAVDNMMRWAFLARRNFEKHVGGNFGAFVSSFYRREKYT